MRFWIRCSSLVLLLIATTIGMAKKRESVGFDTPFPFYIGASIGYGSTDWNMLVANPDSSASYVSPTSATDEGLTYGGMIGYQFSPMFAMEFGYTHFANTKLGFDPYAVYWNLPEPTTVVSHTNAFDLVGKFIVPVKGTDHFDAFASAGMGVVRRSDILTTTNRIGASFGVGMIFMINRHFSTEAGFQYWTGFGRADDGPAYKYVPFLYKGYVSGSYHWAM